MFQKINCINLLRFRKMNTVMNVRNRENGGRMNYASYIKELKEKLHEQYIHEWMFDHHYIPTVLGCLLSSASDIYMMPALFQLLLEMELEEDTSIVILAKRFERIWPNQELAQLIEEIIEYSL